MAEEKVLVCKHLLSDEIIYRKHFDTAVECQNEYLKRAPFCCSDFEYYKTDQIDLPDVDMPYYVISRPTYFGRNVFEVFPEDKLDYDFRDHSICFDSAIDACATALYYNGLISYEEMEKIIGHSY